MGEKNIHAKLYAQQPRKAKSNMREAEACETEHAVRFILQGNASPNSSKTSWSAVIPSFHT